MNTHILFSFLQPHLRLLGSTLLCLSAGLLSAQSPNLVPNHFAYYPGEPITAHFSGGPGNKKDWIGIYVKEQVPGQVGSTLWNYVDGTQNGNTALREGTILFPNGLNRVDSWELYFLENDGYTVLTKTPFEIIDPSAPKVHASKPVYTAGENISITFTNGPGAAKDWIGLYALPESPGNQNSTRWYYVDGTQTGVLGKADGVISFEGGVSKVGKFAAFLLANDGYSVLATEFFEVQPAAVQSQLRVVSLEPTNLSTNAPPNAPLNAKISLGNSKINLNSVELKLDGSLVKPTVQDLGSEVVLTFTSSELLQPASEHTYSLKLSDVSGSPLEVSTKFKVTSYTNLQLTTPLVFENFDSLNEGSLPPGWTSTSFTEVLIPEFDFANLNSATFANWTSVNVDRFKVPFLTYGGTEKTDDYNRVLANPGNIVLNGKLIESLGSGKVLFANSGYRNGRSQVMILNTPDFDLSSASGVKLAFHSLWEQNQDSIALIEFSTDQGKTWKSVAYFIDAADIKRNEAGGIDVESTMNTEYGDVATYTDDQGNELGGTYGSFALAPIHPSMESHILGRINDSSTDGKRVEIFSLPLADKQASVRFRFVHAGTDSWYWGLDNFGIYTDTTPSPVGLKATKTATGAIRLSWEGLAKGFKLETATSVLGPWTIQDSNPPANGFAEVPTTSAQSYFRLR